MVDLSLDDAHGHSFVCIPASQARLLAYRLLAASAENAFYVEQARYQAERPHRGGHERELAQLAGDPAEYLRAVQRHGFVLGPCDQQALDELDPEANGGGR